MLNSIRDFLNDVPESVWVLIGVFITSIFSGRQFSKQLTAENERHERELTHNDLVKKQEFEASVKRDIYIGGINHLAGLLEAFVTMGNNTDYDVKFGADVSAGLARVNLIAQKNLLQAIDNFSDEFAKAVEVVFPLKMQIADMAVDLDTSAKNRDSSLDMMKSCTAKIDNLNLQGIFSGNYIDSLLMQHDNFSKEFDLQMTISNDLLKNLDVFRRNFLITIVEFHQPLFVAYSKILVAMRQELEWETDGDTISLFEFYVNQQSVRLQKMIKTLLALKK